MKFRSFNGYFKNGLGGDGSVDVTFVESEAGVLTIGGLTAEQAMRVVGFIETGVTLVPVQGISEVPYAEPTIGGKRTRRGSEAAPKSAAEAQVSAGPAVVAGGVGAVADAKAIGEWADKAGTAIAGMDAERNTLAGAAHAAAEAKAVVVRSAAAVEVLAPPPEQLPLPPAAQAAEVLGGPADMAWLKGELPTEVKGAARALHLAQELRHRGIITQEELTQAFTILKARGDVDVLKAIDDVGERVALLWDRLPPIA